MAAPEDEGDFDDVGDQLSNEGSAGGSPAVGPKTSAGSEGSLGKDDAGMDDEEAFDKDHPLPATTGSNRKTSGQGSAGRIEPGRGSAGGIEPGRGSAGGIESGRGSAEKIGSGRGSAGKIGSGRGSTGKIGSERGSGGIDTGRGSGKIDTGRGSGEIDTGLGSGEIDTGRGSGRIGPGRGSGRIGSGRGSGRIETGRGSGRIETGGGSGRIGSGRGSGTIETGRGSGEIDIGGGPQGSGNLLSKQGSQVPGPPRPGPPRPGLPRPGPPKKKSMLDTLKSPSLKMLKPNLSSTRKPKTSKLPVPGKPRQKQGLLAKISRSATSFVSMLGFGKKKPPPPPPKPKPRPPPASPKPQRPKTSSLSPAPSKSPSVASLPPKDEKSVDEPSKKKSEQASEKSPAKRLSKILTKSVLERIADEVMKLARPSFDDVRGRTGGMCGTPAKPAAHETSNLCDRCHYRPPVTTVALASPLPFDVTEFADLLVGSDPYPRRGVLELARQFECPVPTFTAVSPYPMSVAPPFQPPSRALFSPQLYPPPHFSSGGPPSFPQFPPYPGGAVPFGFHPGMPPMHNPFAAPYRNSAGRTWPQPPFPNPGFGMSYGSRPMPMHSFPKHPCELNPALCQQNFPICPCGCGRPVAGPSFYR